MGTEGIGSSVIIALAALMWFLYLVPTWFKRREYLATERNAVRLQQTMRILAESAELPSVVRVEATARTVAAQQRILRQQRRREGSRVSPTRFDTAARFDEAERSVERGAQTRRRLRRSRAMASAVLVVSFVAAGFGISALANGGNWLLLVASLIVAAGSVALLTQAATVTKARVELRHAATASASTSTFHDHADYAPTRRPGWMPVPVPKPLYLSQPAPVARASRMAAAVPAAEVDHAAVLRKAAAEAERALRAAQEAPEVTRIGRFASMGVLDPTATNSADLDEILRRRRAVG